MKIMYTVRVHRFLKSRHRHHPCRSFSSIITRYRIFFVLNTPMLATSANVLHCLLITAYSVVFLLLLTYLFTTYLGDNTNVLRDCSPPLILCSHRTRLEVIAPTSRVRTFTSQLSCLKLTVNNKIQNNFVQIFVIVIFTGNTNCAFAFLFIAYQNKEVIPGI